MGKLRKIAKLIGMLSFVFGLILTIGALIDPEGRIILIIGIPLLILGIILIKASLKVKNNETSDEKHVVQTDNNVTKAENENTNTKSVKETKPQPNVLQFKISGTSFRNKEIKNIVKEATDYYLDTDKWEGFTNKEIKEYGDDGARYYEFDELIFDKSEIKIIPETDNKYDPNALAFYIDDIHVGYIPANKTKKVKSILDKDYSIFAYIRGGRYKSYDSYEEKVKIHTLEYGISVDIFYE